LVAGTLMKGENHFVSQVFGDAFVRIASATDPGRRAGLPADNIAVLPGIHHMVMAHSPEVYARIRAWFGALVEVPPEPLEGRAPPRVEEQPAITSQHHRPLERADAYRALVQDAVEHGVTAIQEVQEELTARPYRLLELVTPLRTPTRVVRSVHFAAVRATYDAIRLVNRLVGTVFHEGVKWFDDTSDAPGHQVGGVQTATNSPPR
jgi:hypothetical protein